MVSGGMVILSPGLPMGKRREGRGLRGDHDEPTTHSDVDLSDSVRTSRAVADFAAVKKAYDAGEYGAAIRELKPLATAGSPEAQFCMGVFYHDGIGVSPTRTRCATARRCKSVPARRTSVMATNVGTISGRIPGHGYALGSSGSRTYIAIATTLSAQSGAGVLDLGKLFWADIAWVDSRVAACSKSVVPFVPPPIDEAQNARHEHTSTSRREFEYGGEMVRKRRPGANLQRRV